MSKRGAIIDFKYVKAEDMDITYLREKFKRIRAQQKGEEKAKAASVKAVVTEISTKRHK